MSSFKSRFGLSFESYRDDFENSYNFRHGSLVNHALNISWGLDCERYNTWVVGTISKQENKIFKNHEHRTEEARHSLR